MAYNKKKDQIQFDGEWIAIVICFAIWWPLGIILLFNHLKKMRKKGKTAAQFAGVGGSLLGVGLLMRLLGMMRGLIVMLFGAGMLGAAKVSQKRESRYRKYLAIIGRSDVLSLSAIAAAIPTTVDLAAHDLQDMIDRGYFADGAYVDNRNKRFVQNSDAVAFDQSTIVVEPVHEEPVHEEKKPEEPVYEAQPDEAEEDVFARYLRQLRQVNDRIADEVISEKIERIERISARIFDLIREKPETGKKARPFINYYLPTTLKLLDSYALLEKQGIEGDNITASKKQIEAIMDTLIAGFEKQLDQLFGQQAMDISSDIDVLETMLAKDGLKENKYVMR